MTTNLVDAKPKPAKPGEKGSATGESDAHVFNCPSCARALSEGTSVCPGCGARLIMGVLLRRAGAILALGVVIGILVGGAAMASAITLSLQDQANRAAAAEAAAAATAAPTVAPVASPAATVLPTPPAGYTDVGIPGAPAGAVSALKVSTTVNDRIALDAEALTTALAKKDVTSIELARALRALAADSSLGRDQTARMTAWPAARRVVDGLDRFYLAIGDTARSGLHASLADIASYRGTSSTMLGVLAGLESVDADARDFAQSLDIELPAAARPSATPGATTP